MSRRLVLDCDPGCDDALALLLALGSGVYSHIDVLTVAGNVGIAQTTQNARRLCAFARWHEVGNGQDHLVKLFRGSRTSIRGEVANAASVHGRDGMGDVPIEVLVAPGQVDGYFRRHPKLAQGRKENLTHLRNDFLGMYPKIQEQTAVEYLRSFALEELGGSSEELDLVCTGPLTNLALALFSLSIPEQRVFWSRWRRVVFMGGAIGTAGNISYAAEFNLRADPDAFAAVLNSVRNSAVEERRLPILVPLDVTEQVVLWAPTWLQKGEEFDRLGDVSKALLCLLRKYFLFHAVSYPPPLSAAILEGKTSDLSAKDWLSEAAAQKLDRELKELFRTSRRRGGGGLKVLPLWCYLHDPSALWIAMNADGFPESNFEKAHVQVDVTTLGHGRGHLCSVQPRRSFFTPIGEAQRGDLLPIRLPRFEGVVGELRSSLIGALRDLVVGLR